MTDGEYQATFFIRKKKKKKKKTHKSWDISSLHLFGINFLFFWLCRSWRTDWKWNSRHWIRGGSFTADAFVTETCILQAQPITWPLLNPPKFTEAATLIFSFTYNKCGGAPVGGAAAAEATQSRSLTGRIRCVLHCRLVSWNTLLQSTWVRLNSDSAIVHVGTLWISFFCLYTKISL